MEEEFRKIITMIKEETLDPEETKKYILVIKRLLEKSYIGMEEQDDAQGLEDFLFDYQKDLEFRGNAENIFEGMFRHCVYKKILSDFKKDRRTFNSTVDRAKNKEQTQEMSEIIANADIDQAMVRIVESVLMKKGNVRSEEIFSEIQIQNQIVVENLRQRMIKIIREVVMMLEEYGFIDDYITESNTQLEKLGLEKLKYIKRNPIPDEQYAIEYDENGKVKYNSKGEVIKKKVKDGEDIGVIDSFSEESLEKLSTDDLILMTAFWENKYLEERMKISKAMSTIKTLGLWDVVLNGNIADVQQVDEAKVNGALKKDLALSYLCGDNLMITDRMRTQYNKFLEEEGIKGANMLENEIEETFPELLNLQMATRDVATLEYLVIYLLQMKELKPDEWGVVKEETDELEKEDDESITLAVENRNFRGPLIMEISKEALQSLLKTDGSNYPVYSKKIDKTYSGITSKMYLSSNKFFNAVVKNYYKENPKSTLLANLAGKKVKEER